MNMKFQTTLLALIASIAASPTSFTKTSLTKRQIGGPASTGEVCPQAQDLWYLTTNQYYYQIGCSVDTAGNQAIAVYAGVSNVLDCAQHCDTWNAIAATNPKCYSATYYKAPADGINNCVLRPVSGGGYAFADGGNAESAFLGPKAS